jgi:hypothetical protein
MSVRDSFDGIGGYVIVAGLLLFFSVLGLLVEVQSPDKVLWTGTKVVGSEQGGIVLYDFRGHQYSLDGDGVDTRAHIDVYLNPSDPSSAELNSVVNRVIDLGFTIIPFTLSLLVMLAGLYHRRAIDKVRIREVREYGGGLDPEFVESYLKRLRQRDD